MGDKTEKFQSSCHRRTVAGNISRESRDCNFSSPPITHPVSPNDNHRFTIPNSHPKSPTPSLPSQLPSFLKMVVAQHQLQAQKKDSDKNRRISFFEDSGELAPGQLYSTESGRYR